MRSIHCALLLCLPKFRYIPTASLNRSLRSNPSGRLAGCGAGPAPLPLLPGAADGRGARAGRCCWRQGNPGEADPPPPRVCPLGAAPRPRGEITLAHLPDASGSRDLRARGAPSPGLVWEAGADAHVPAARAQGLYIGPQRKLNGLREETWAREGRRGDLCARQKQ